MVVLNELHQSDVFGSACDYVLSLDETGGRRLLDGLGRCSRLDDRRIPAIPSEKQHPIRAQS